MPKKGISTLAAARLQCWTILLSAYTYDIVYRPTKLHANADAYQEYHYTVVKNHTVFVMIAFLI